MRCECCSSEMERHSTIYICPKCLTMYMMVNDKIGKSFIAPDGFQNSYRNNYNDLNSNNPDKIINACSRLSLLWNENPFLLCRCGLGYKQKKMYKEAMTLYKKAESLCPDYAILLLNISILIFESENNLSAALEYIERAKTIVNTDDVDYGKIYGNYAFFVGKNGNIDLAKQSLDEAERYGYKNGDAIRQMLGLESDTGLSKKTSGLMSGIFGGVKDAVLKSKQDAAVRKVYKEEEEKRKAHTQRIEHSRALTPQEQQTIDMIKMERDAKIQEWVRQGVGFWEASFTRSAPYDNKISEIEKRAVWYEEITIPPEVSPNVPINVDEEAIRRAVAEKRPIPKPQNPINPEYIKWQKSKNNSNI